MDDVREVKVVLARNLRIRRKRLHLTQEEAAERAGITYKYWQRLEMVSQSDLPSLPTLNKMAKVLKIPLYLLLK